MLEKEHRDQEADPQDPRSGAGLLKRIFTAPHKNIAEQEKEIRFTRASQATFFFILSVVFVMIFVSSLFCMFINWGPWHTDFNEYWWMSLIALIPSFICLRIAFQCIRHAYLILTPMGVEIFPFLKPQENLQVIFWSDIHHAEVEGDTLKLHANEEETSGTILSLKPLGRKNYHLLEVAIEGRLKQS